MKNELEVLELVEAALFNLQQMPKLNPSVLNTPTFAIVEIQLKQAVDLLEEE